MSVGGGDPAPGTPGPPSADAPWVSPGLHALDDLLRKLESSSPAALDTGLRVLLEQLGGANAQLRGADDALRDERERVTGLLDDRRAGAAQRLWVASLLPLPMLVTDLRGDVTAANAAVGRLLGVAVASLLHRPLAELVRPQERAVVQAMIDRAGTEPARTRVELVPRRGTPFAAELLVTSEGAGGAELTWTVSAVGGRELDDDGGLEALRLAAGFADLCRLPGGDMDLRAVVGAVAEVVRRTLPAAASVTVALGPPSEPVLVASTGDSAASVDGLQLRAGEGPSMSAYATREPVLADELATDPRWPTFAPLVGGHAARSALAVPVVAAGELVGVITCYGRTASFGEPAVQAAELLGGAAGAVLASVIQRDRLRELAEHLHQALTSREEIDVAKGVVMAQRGGTPDDAFAYLAGLSQQQNVKLRDVARRIVEQASGGPLAPEGTRRRA